MAVGNTGAAGVNPTHQNTQAQLSANDAIQQIQSATDAMETATQIFDSEAQGVNVKQVKPHLEGEGITQPKQQPEVKEAKSTAGLEAYAASLTATEELEKKKRKKKLQTFSEKMETLESMGEVIDPENVPEEEKGVFKTFLKNLGMIKELRGRLKRLERERKELETRLESVKSETEKRKDFD